MLSRDPAKAVRMREALEVLRSLGHDTRYLTRPIERVLRAIEDGA